MPGGRPRRVSKQDDPVDEMVRGAVEQLAIASGRRSTRKQDAEPSGHLLFAVTAARFAAAADRIAHAYVTKAREDDGVTWEQVGEAFGTSRQSAHERFGPNRTP